jgi:hypothetical protein
MSFSDSGVGVKGIVDELNDFVETLLATSLSPWFGMPRAET